jgi:hypothetical protein
MTEHDVKNFVQAIHSAYWKIDFREFCVRAGFQPDAYAQAKFMEWAKLNAALREFDPTTIACIIGAAPTKEAK